MTECYVIKNKDGEYFMGLESEETTKDLSVALFYDENEKNIMKKAYPQYSFVKIIIGESDELCPKIFKSTISSGLNNQKDTCDKIRRELKQVELDIDNDPSLISDEYKLQLKQKSVYKNIYKILDKIEKGEM